MVLLMSELLGLTGAVVADRWAAEQGAGCPVAAPFGRPHQSQTGPWSLLECPELHGEISVGTRDVHGYIAGHSNVLPELLFLA